jgi:hypothetical protein
LQDRYKEHDVNIDVFCTGSSSLCRVRHVCISRGIQRDSDVSEQRGDFRLMNEINGESGFSRLTTKQSTKEAWDDESENMSSVKCKE